MKEPQEGKNNSDSFVTDKPATMIQLQDTYGRGELGYEWAHVLYFPNLVFHAVLASGGGD